MPKPVLVSYRLNGVPFVPPTADTCDRAILKLNYVKSFLPTGCGQHLDDVIAMVETIKDEIKRAAVPSATAYCLNWKSEPAHNVD